MIHRRLSFCLLSLLVTSSILAPASFIYRGGLVTAAPPPPGDFSIAVSPSFLAISAGSSGASTVFLSGIDGFSGTVRVTASVDPLITNGPTFSLSRNNVHLSFNETATVTITVSADSATAAVDYTLNIMASSGDLTHSASILLRVADFGIAAGPDSLAVFPGLSVSFSITLFSLNGFEGIASLAGTVSPRVADGPGALLSPDTLSLVPGGAAVSTLTVVTSPNTPDDSYTVTVTATSGPLSRSVSVTVIVSSALVPDFTLLVSHTGISMQAGSSVTELVSLASQNGFSGVVSLSTTVSPLVSDGPVASVSPSIVTLQGGGSAFSTLTISTVSTTPAGNYVVTVNGTGGGITHSFQVSLTVLGAIMLPVADFFISPINPREGEVVFFDGSISFDPDGFIVGWRWSFGDGFGATGTFVSHVYSSPGNYTVTLLVVDNANATASKTVVLFVGVIGENVPPRAAFSSFPNATRVGEPVFFDASPSFDPDGFIVNWFWEFGDGSTGNGTFVSHTYFNTGNYTVTLTVMDNRNATDSVRKAVLVQSPNIPPVASLTFFPTRPVEGEFVQFDGSGSFDPDGSLIDWFWTFGDGSIGFGPFTSHVYFRPGNYTVNLTVTDNDGARGMTSVIIQVRPRPAHDVGVVFIDIQPRVAVSSQFVNIQVGLSNKGNSTEKVDLTVYFDSEVAATLRGITLYPTCPFCFPNTVNVIWDTFGVAAGNYTISAMVFLATDENLDDNTLIDGAITILPPPTLTVTPSSGSLGTKATVHGSGFLPAPPFFGGTQVFVTFDEMFMGFTVVRNGEFDFTFNVPHAEAGPHTIKAFDSFSGARASTSFQVTVVPPTGHLEIRIDVGVVYFPGDTAAITLLATLNGGSEGLQDLQVQLVLIKPDGTKSTLDATLTEPGVFRATYPIPTSGSLGTYSLIARAHLPTPLDASDLRSFEVKPSWLRQQGPAVASAAAIVGLFSAVGLAWKKGYFNKRDEPEIID